MNKEEILKKIDLLEKNLGDLREQLDICKREEWKKSQKFIVKLSNESIVLLTQKDIDDLNFQYSIEKQRFGESKGSIISINAQSDPDTCNHYFVKQPYGNSWSDYYRCAYCGKDDVAT